MYKIGVKKFYSDFVRLGHELRSLVCKTEISEGTGKAGEEQNDGKRRKAPKSCRRKQNRLHATAFFVVTRDERRSLRLPRVFWRSVLTFCTKREKIRSG